MSNKRVWSLFSVLMVFALLLTACAPAVTPAPATQAPAATKTPAPAGPAVGGNLVVGITGDPYNLATWISNDLNSLMVMNLVLPNLMVTDAKANKVPYVMKEYKVSADGKEYTVKLNEGITWHDGKPFTADDLVFTSQYVVKYKLSFNADIFADVAKAEVIDATTAKFTLKKPSANFITQAGFQVKVMPKHIYENVTDPMNFIYNGVGYGPYKIKEFKKGEYYTLERVPNWPLANGGKGAYLDTITFRIYPDSNALVLAMKNGEVQVSGSALPVAAQNQLEASPDQFGIQRVNSLGYGYFGLNYKNEFLKDVKVRTAIAMTIDRDALINTAMQGGAIRMDTPISPVHADLVKSAIKYPVFDIEGAKKILEDASYKDVDKDGVREGPDGKKKLEFELLMRSSTANVDAIANIFKANMDKAGMKINIKIADPATYADRVTKQRTFDINAVDWGLIDDPDSSLGTIYMSSAQLNFMGYKNEKIDQLLVQSSQELDYAKRIAIMDEFQKEFVKELPAINSWVRVNAYGYSKNFDGWGLTPGPYGLMDCKDLVKVYKVK